MNNSIFISYDNLPPNYVPNNTSLYNINRVTPAYVRPKEEYNAEGKFTGFSWRCGDSVIIELCTRGEVQYDDTTYVEASDYLKGKKFEITLYNFRYESIYSEIVEASADYKFYIESDLSNKLVPSLYYIMVTLIDEENNIRQTMLDWNSLRFIVR